MLDTPLTRKLIALALEEDEASNDITAKLTVPSGHRSVARILARQRLVVCGLSLTGLIARVGSWSFDITLRKEDGEWVEDGEVLAEVSGATRDLLSFERTLLNFLQRTCGVATYTRNFCEGKPAITVLDTRKTMPGWRELDKYATRVGGASNHRFSLADMILVKNNHIDAHPDGIRGALSDVVRGRPEGISWEVEVRDLSELAIALEFSPTMVMLDNFKDEALSAALTLVRGVPNPPMVEVSGGVSKARLHAIASSGVDAVSVGALTTQAPNVDISMRISPLPHD